MIHTKPNQDIRLKAREAGIPMWMVARELGWSDSKLYAMLRKALSDDDRGALLQAIDSLSEA